MPPRLTSNNVDKSPILDTTSLPPTINSDEGLNKNNDNDSLHSIINNISNENIKLYHRFKYELCNQKHKSCFCNDLSRFDLKEPNGLLNLEKCFAPNRHTTIIVRSVFLLWSLHVLYVDVTHYPPHNLYIYMGYLTHWGHTMSISYFISALYCTIKRSSLLIQPFLTEGPIIPLFPVRLAWVLYSIVAPMEICITLLYWSADYAGGQITYVNIMEHGMICLLILFDGAILSSIPIRLKMFPYFISVCITYLLWSIIDAVLEIGNGEWGPEYEDDALYEVLNWNDSSKTALIVSSTVICIIAPLIYLFCWMLSLWDLTFCSFNGYRRCVIYNQDGEDEEMGAAGPTIADESNNDLEKDFDYKEMEMS